MSASAKTSTSASVHRSPESTPGPGLGPDWTLVQEGPGFYIAERYVTTYLGAPQKVSEGAESMAQLEAKCAGYDAHQAHLPGSNLPTTIVLPGG